MSLFRARESESLKDETGFRSVKVKGRAVGWWKSRQKVATIPNRPATSEVTIAQLVLIKQLENDMLTTTALLLRWPLTGTKVGHVKLWARPFPATSHGSRPAPGVQDLDTVLTGSGEETRFIMQCLS